MFTRYQKYEPSVKHGHLKRKHVHLHGLICITNIKINLEHSGIIIN